MNRKALFTLITAQAFAVAAPAQPLDAAGPDRERARTLIERRLEQTREQEASLERALEMLDRGAPIDEVRREALPDRRGAFDAARFRGDPADVGEAAPREADDLLPIVREADPGAFERLRELRERDPERFREALREHGPRLRRLAELRRDDPEAFARRVEMMRDLREARSLAQALVSARRDGDEAAAERLLDRLRSTIDAQFERLLESRRAELADAEARLDGLRERLEAFEGSRERIVSQRVRALVDRAESEDRGGRRE